MDKAVIYYTDNSLDPKFERFCQEQLTLALRDVKCHLISVSQKPIHFGYNICVGDIGRSWASLYTQLLEGIRQVNASIIYLAEHDCLYTPEHFAFTPSERGVFYYNTNHWFVQLKNGIYGYRYRIPMSQCVGFKEDFIEAVTERLAIAKQGFQIRKGIMGAGEFGICDNRIAFVGWQHEGKSFDAEEFRTTLPNIDIRHGGNFTGRRKTDKQTMTLPHWGEFLPLYDKWMAMYGPSTTGN